MSLEGALQSLKYSPDSEYALTASVEIDLPEMSPPEEYNSISTRAQILALLYCRPGMQMVGKEGFPADRNPGAAQGKGNKATLSPYPQFTEASEISDIIPKSMIAMCDGDGHMGQDHKYGSCTDALQPPLGSLSKSTVVPMAT
ncbi:unnamed protein product [Caretta caretta]